MADETRIETSTSWRSRQDVGDDANIVVWTVTGTADSVAEIGEILAWLVSGLILSDFPTGICASNPVLHSHPVRPGAKCTSFTISPLLSQERRRDHAHPASGNCWTDVLGNTIHVRGYPTARRAEHHTGMEVSLATMMALVRSERLGRFKGHFCIKGYCSIILPTRQRGDCIYWHLITNRGGEYIHSTDYRVQRFWNVYPKDLSLARLVTSRHILGWCDNIRNLAGTYDLACSIAASLYGNSYIATLTLPHFSTSSLWSAVATIPGNRYVSGILQHQLTTSCSVTKTNKFIMIKGNELRSDPEQALQPLNIVSVGQVSATRALAVRLTKSRSAGANSSPEEWRP
jgi:hypothetical protein